MLGLKLNHVSVRGNWSLWLLSVCCQISASEKSCYMHDTLTCLLRHSRNIENGSWCHMAPHHQFCVFCASQVFTVCLEFKHSDLTWLSVDCYYFWPHCLLINIGSGLIMGCHYNGKHYLYQLYLSSLRGIGIGEIIASLKNNQISIYTYIYFVWLPNIFCWYLNPSIFKLLTYNFLHSILQNQFLFY